MTDREAMFEAHVRFELDRWRADARAAAIAEEVDRLYEWLAAVSLSEIVDEETARRWAQAAVCEWPLTDEVRSRVEEGVRAAYVGLADETAPVGDVLTREAYDEVAETVIGMRALRAEVITQLTTNTAYSQLVSHVLYHGIKSYLLTENVVARKVPGASSLVRLGQRAVSSAAPNLERGIDRQLIAFISLNVHETIKESRRYLDAMLDDDLLRTVADEIWAANADRSVADATALVEEDAVEGLVASVWRLWASLRTSPVVAGLAGQVVGELYRAHGDRPVAALLEDAGLARDRVGEGVASAAGPVVEAALASGFLESRIRARLGAFYAGYVPAPARPSRTRRT